EPMPFARVAEPFARDLERPTDRRLRQDQNPQAEQGNKDDRRTPHRHKPLERPGQERSDDAAARPVLGCARCDVGRALEQVPQAEHARDADAESDRDPWTVGTGPRDEHLIREVAEEDRREDAADAEEATEGKLEETADGSGGV